MLTHIIVREISLITPSSVVYIFNIYNIFNCYLPWKSTISLNYSFITTSAGLSHFFHTHNFKTNIFFKKEKNQGQTNKLFLSPPLHCSVFTVWSLWKLLAQVQTLSTDRQRCRAPWEDKIPRSHLPPTQLSLDSLDGFKQGGDPARPLTHKKKRPWAAWGRGATCRAPLRSPCVIWDAFGPRLSARSVCIPLPAPFKGSITTPAERMHICGETPILLSPPTSTVCLSVCGYGALAFMESPSLT